MSARAKTLAPTRGDSPLPLYQQIKDRILGRIAGGQWRPGTKIPSENQLLRELQVSRMTVNRALRELAQEGHIQRVAGVGSFVSQPPRHASLIELRNIAEEIRSQGGVHSAQLCWCQEEPLDIVLAERMELPVGTPCVHIQLVHRRDELPIQLEDRWIDPQLVPDCLEVDFTQTTPSEHLLRSIRPDEMEHLVQAILPDASTCELLAVPATEPCLRLERRTWNQSRVVTFAALTYPSTRYDLGARYSLRPSADPAQDSPLPGGYLRRPTEPAPKQAFQPRLDD